MFDTIYMKFPNREIYGDRKQVSGCQELGRGLELGRNRGVTVNWYGVSFWGDENVPNMIEVMVIQLGELQTNH